ncbi:MAG: hypothetical protein K1X94_09340 [Sandaracinaceae bacterium]|nr:hypothetical protein [Sandaracinaceae bacterium]
MTDRRDAPKHVIELSHDDDDDDFRGPPAVHHASARRGYLARPRRAKRSVFLADPIDSLREPPVPLGQLLGELWGELVEGARALERTVSLRALA